MRRALPLLAVLLLAGCAGAAAPTLDERIDDIDTAVDLYRTVAGAECDRPTEPNHMESTIGVRCEDGAMIVWGEEDREENVQQLMAAMLSDDGTDAVVGVNVTIMNVDRAAVAGQIGGQHV